jgi:hypothetical protein
VLNVDPLVDFGLLVVSNRVVTRQFYIYNQGSRDGDFTLNYSGKYQLSISPTSGRVCRNSAQAIKVGNDAE